MCRPLRPKIMLGQSDSEDNSQANFLQTVHHTNECDRAAVCQIAKCVTGNYVARRFTSPSPPPLPLFLYKNNFVNSDKSYPVGTCEPKPNGNTSFGDAHLLINRWLRMDSLSILDRIKGVRFLGFNFLK